MEERALTSRMKPTVLIVGSRAAQVRHYLQCMLGAETEWNLDAGHIDKPEITKLRARILTVTDIPDHLSGSMRKLMRVLPDRSGMLVGYGRSGELRKAVRGFHATYRWFDEDHLWVGSGRAKDPLAFSAAARVAHELGTPAEVIRASVTA